MGEVTSSMDSIFEHLASLVASRATSSARQKRRGAGCVPAKASLLGRSCWTRASRTSGSTIVCFRRSHVASRRGVHSVCARRVAVFSNTYLFVHYFCLEEQRPANIGARELSY